MSDEDEQTSSRTTLPDGAGGEAGAQRWRRGSAIGRYLVLEPVGAGGIGVVLAGYDPQLDRKVAIKLLHPSQRTSSEALRERVLREARALARVVHPNIVSVYDAGFHGSELFVVMELVEGDDLRKWLRAGERGVDEIVGAFMQAGRGLVAAHEAGLVHRDFKPDNVLVGRDGRVRVADFGLVRVLDAGIGEDLEITPAESLTTTRTGALVGTPAYMAPEQHACARVDERADQFAFCVALYEALHGVRPFAGETYAELADNVKSGRLRPRGASRRVVPAWIQAVIARGLALRPEDRYPSMTALLAALAADPAAARARRVRLGVAAAAGVALAGAALLGLATRDDTPKLCRSAAAEVARAWSPARRAAIETAFRASGRPYAADVLASVAARLDAYAAGWTAMRTDACEATHYRGTQSGAVLDLRMRCLDARLHALGATTELLAGADAKTVDKAVTMSGELPALAACADVDALAAVRPPPADPAARARVDALGARLAAAAAQRRAGRYADALAAVATIVEEARSTGHAPLLADALAERGVLEKGLSRYAAAELTLREALLVVAAAHDDAAQARTIVELAGVIANGLVRLDDIPRVRPFVDAALARAPGSDLARAYWLSIQGQVARRQAQFDVADGYLVEALAIREHLLPTGDPAIATSLTLLGLNRGDRGDAAGARAMLERGLAVAEGTYGGAHPEVATILQALGLVLEDLGDYPAARALVERSLTIRRATLGNAHSDTAQSMNSLAIILLRQDENARAAELLEGAVAAREKIYGPEHEAVAPPLVNLGLAYFRLRRDADAERSYRRAMAIYEKRYGRGHPRMAAVAGNLGDVYVRQRRFADALPLITLELEASQKAHGPEHRDVFTARTDLADVLIDLGRLADARRQLDEAARVIDKAVPPGHSDRGFLDRALGKLALAEGRRAAAARHLERAIALWSAQHVEADALAEVRAMLAATRTLGRGARRKPL